MNKADCILYHVGHYGFLPQFMLHKLIFHKNKKAVFLIDQIIMNNQTIDFLKQKETEHDNPFGEFILYSDRPFLQISGEKEVEENLLHFFDTLLQEKGYSLDAFEEIHSGFDTYSGFTTYLILKKCAYTLWDTGISTILRDRYSSNDRNGKINAYTAVMQRLRALNADNDYAVNIVWRNSNLPDIKNKNFIIFESENLLSNIEEIDRKTLLEFFGYREELSEKTEVYVLIPSSGWFVGAYGLSKKQFFLTYTTWLDYFLVDGHSYLLIKPHPNYDFPEHIWKSEFSRKKSVACKPLPGYFPADYLPIIPNISLETILSTGSTGSKITAKKTIDATFEFTSQFQKLNKVFIAYDLAKKIITDKTAFHHRYSAGFIKKCFQFLFPEYVQKEVKGINMNILKGDIYALIDNCAPCEQQNILNGLQDASMEAIAVFMNSDNRYDFYHLNKRELIDFIVPVRIQKIARSNDVNMDLQDEYIYVFSKNAEIREKVRNYECSKMLEFTGVEVRVTPLTKQEEENLLIKMRLAAAERDLSEVMDWKDKLIKKIQELI